MITPKQQILLDQLKEKIPDLFSKFDPLVLPDQHSILVHTRVTEIVNQISFDSLNPKPRTIIHQMSYPEQVIDLWTRQYIHPPGAPCPF